MDFFANQDTARRKTKWLVVYFAVAVVLIVVSLYFVAVLAMQAVAAKTHAADGAVPPLHWWHPELCAAVTVITLAVIILGSLYKTLELRRGGEAVAVMLGGRRLNRANATASQQRLLNIVEEMAIASGTPVPPVFLLDREDGINAFAAGYTLDDAVIGVNRGTVEYLSRDELQGVIAHEFSHILNGDMRLNIRLIGLLHGILLIAIIGYYILRSGAYSGSSRRDEGGAGIAILGVGVGAIVIGSVGLFFGRLIKAAVSRQREFLADASAVQFTRNPDGIAGALKKIGGLVYGSKMKSPEAEQASHMFFGSCRQAFIGLLATHPPLAERIRRIDPRFDGRYPAVKPLATAEVVESEAAGQPRDRGFGAFPFPRPLPIPGMEAAGRAIPLDPALVLASVGLVNQQRVDQSARWLDGLPAPLRAALDEPFSTRAIVFAMLLDARESVRDEQLATVAQREGAPTRRETERLVAVVHAAGEEARLPLIEIAQATLRELSRDQFQSFRATVDELVRADQRLDLREFVLQRLLIGALEKHFYPPKRLATQYHSLRGVVAETALLLSALSYVGASDQQQARRALDQAAAPLRERGIDLELLPQDACRLTHIGQALDKLALLAAPLKKRLVSSAAMAVATDGLVTPSEAELFRTIAAALEVPVPPITIGAIEAGTPT
ncbi:MAG: M48 family metallopeptidase [Planctomycetales bacterium]|nr:M48 family metallopeptidase [Planctomycetales bacterium]